MAFLGLNSVSVLNSTVLFFSCDTGAVITVPSLRNFDNVVLFVRLNGGVVVEVVRVVPIDLHLFRDKDSVRASGFVVSGPSAVLLER